MQEKTHPKTIRVRCGCALLNFAPVYCVVKASDEPLGFVSKAGHPGGLCWWGTRESIKNCEMPACAYTVRIWRQKASMRCLAPCHALRCSACSVIAFS